MSQQEIENPERCSFGKGSGVSHGPNAPGAAILARAIRNQLSGLFHELAVHPEERLAEPDAAWIIVVDENPLVLVLGMDRQADVAPVAHQQQLRNLVHRKR